MTLQGHSEEVTSVAWCPTDFTKVKAKANFSFEARRSNLLHPGFPFFAKTSGVASRSPAAKLSSPDAP